MTTIRQAVADYLSMRRALGFKLRKDGILLFDFVSFLESRGATYINIKLAVEWAQQPRSSSANWASRLCTIRQFAIYRSAVDVRTEIPPTGLWPFGKRRARPYIYSNREIQRLLKAALNFKGRHPLKGEMYHCLFGLLAVSGMRIGEALNLKLKDVDLAAGVVTIVEGKLGKSRIVPLHASTTRVLSDYRKRRDKFLTGRTAEYFFISSTGTRLHTSAVHVVFDALCKEIGLDRTDHKTSPRIHDFRHRFAVETLLQWYRNGDDVERMIPVLSTYLGHVDVTCTYWYLSAAPELMGLAVQRLDDRWEANS